MEKAKQISRSMYEHSFVRYVAIGGSTFVLDFTLLIILHSVLRVPVLIAATISYWLSIAFNFTANRFWTFSATETHIAKHAVAYCILLGINYLFTIGVIAGVTHMGGAYTVAKVLAVAIQVPWTYVAYKKIIFR